MFLLRLTNIRLPTVRLVFIKLFFENLSICSHLIMYTLSLFEKETCIILWDPNKSFLYHNLELNKSAFVLLAWLRASCQTLDTFGGDIITKQCLLRRLSFLTSSSCSFAAHAAEPVRACSQAKATCTCNVQSLCVYLFHPHVNNIIHYCKQIYFPINGLQSK